MGKRSRSCYAVAVGRERGIFDTWNECSAAVDRFSGAVFRGLDSRAEAEKWLQSHGTNQPPPPPLPAPAQMAVAAVSYRTPFRGVAHDESGADVPLTVPAVVARSSFREVIDVDAIDDPPVGPTHAAAWASATTAAPAQHLQHRLVLYVDGACVGNGSPGAFGGFGVFYGPGDSRNISRPLSPTEQQTNNRAELRACITALTQHPTEPLEVRTDSEYCRRGITEWIPNWKRNGWRRSGNGPIVNLDLWMQFDALVQQRPPHANVQFTHVKGHSGEPGNDAADQLAVAGALSNELNPALRLGPAEPAQAGLAPGAAPDATAGLSIQPPNCPKCLKPARRSVSGPKAKRPYAPFFMCQCGGDGRAISFFKWESDVVLPVPPSAGAGGSCGIPSTTTVKLQGHVGSGTVTVELSLVATLTGELKAAVSFPYCGALIGIIKQLSPLHRSYDPASRIWLVVMSRLNVLLRMLVEEVFITEEQLPALKEFIQKSDEAAKAEQEAALVQSAIINNVPSCVNSFETASIVAPAVERGRVFLPPDYAAVDDDDDSYGGDDDACGDATVYRAAATTTVIHEAAAMAPAVTASNEYLRPFRAMAAHQLATTTTRSHNRPQDYQRVFGKFTCSSCRHFWSSGYVWMDVSSRTFESQQCKKCNNEEEPSWWAPLSGRPPADGMRSSMDGHDTLRCGLCKTLGRPCNYGSYYSEYD